MKKSFSGWRKSKGKQFQNRKKRLSEKETTWFLNSQNTRAPAAEISSLGKSVQPTYHSVVEKYVKYKRY